MAGNRLECSFLIPLKKDALLSDGADHTPEAWQWLDRELFARFGGGTQAPGEYHGFYQDPDTHQRVDDASYRFIVAVKETELDLLRQLLRATCVLFAQKCIYLSIAGLVEFVEVADDNQN